MSNLRPSRFALLAAVVAVPLAASTTSSTAHAAGFLTDQFGSDHGQPAMANAYSVYFNPAAMTGMTGSDITLDGIFAARTLSFNRATSALSPSCGASATCTVASNPTYASANTGQATLFNVLAAPFLGFVTDFGGSKLRLGVAGYVPFGGQVSWDKVSAFQNYPGAPGAVDGPQRFASIATNFNSLYGTLALAYKFEGAHLGIGLSASVINTTIMDTRAHNLNGSDDIIDNNKIVEGRAYVDVSGVQIGAAAGLYWEPTPDLHVGVSYTSQPNFGTMKLTGTFQQYIPGTAPLSESADFYQAYPDVTRLGLAWRVAPDTELRLDASYQRWSVLTSQCIVKAGTPCNTGSDGNVSGPSVLANVPRNFQDSIKVRGGAAYWVLPTTELFGSFSVESSEVPVAYEDPLVFDSVRLAPTLGIRHGFTKHLYAMAAYTYTYLLPVTVTNSAYNTFTGPSKSPSENGTYNSSFYILDAALSYVF
jgi:long-subunit fatty acid transport protein